MNIPAQTSSRKSLVYQIEELLLSPEIPSEFILRRLTQEGVKLKHDDPGMSYVIQVSVAAMRWDIPEIAILTNEALRIDRTALVGMNVALLYKSVNQLTKAAELMTVMTGYIDTDPDVAVRAMMYNVFCARFSECLMVYSKFQGDDMLIEDIRIEAEDVLGLIESASTTEERVQVELQKALDVLTLNKVKLYKVAFALDEDPEEPFSTFMCNLIVNASEEVYEKLEEDLTKSLIDDPEWDLMKLCVHFSRVDFSYAGNAH